MADKKFTAKTGYQNLLDYDPANGIVKYGAYEAFVDQLGLKPTKTVAKFSDYQKSQQPTGIGAAFGFFFKPDPAKQRAAFDAAVADGTYTGADTRRSIGNSMSGPIYDSPYSMGSMAGPKLSNNSNSYRKVSKLGPDSYEINQYDIPNSVDFVNKLSSAASGIAQQADTSALNQNKQDAAARRQGRAATVLSPAAGTAAINS